MSKKIEKSTVAQTAQGKKRLNAPALTAIVIAAVLAVVAVIATIAILTNQNFIVSVHHKDSVLEYIVKKDEIFEEPTDLSLETGESILGYYTDEEYTQPYDFSQPVTQNTQIYVKLKVVTQQTIHFNANSGTGTIADDTKWSDTPLTLPDSTQLSKTGYTFVGWATSETATSDDILDTEEELLLDGQTEVTLYAVWELNDYEIKFTKYSTIGGEDVENYVLRYTVLDDITLPVATRDYASFTGWKVSVYGEDSTSWQNDDVISASELSIGSGHYGNISLAMQFDYQEFRIIFDSNNKDACFTGTAYEYLVNPSSEADYVYIKYQSKFYTAYKKVNDQEVPAFGDGTESGYVAPVVTGMKPGKGAWKGNSNIAANGGSQLTNVYTMNTEKTAFILTAQWQTVRFNLRVVNPETQALDYNNYENYGMTTGTHYYEFATTITLPTPTCQGYIFKGWYTDQTDGELFATGGQELYVDWTSQTTLYTRWELSSVTVYYNANCNASEIPDQSVEISTDSANINTDVTVAENTFVRTGYTFVGWNTQADGQGTTYQPNETLNVGATTNKIILYAIWQAN